VKKSEFSINSLGYKKYATEAISHKLTILAKINDMAENSIFIFACIKASIDEFKS
jgi:hypothetical protein